MNKTRILMITRMLGILCVLGFVMCFMNSTNISASNLTQSQASDVMEDDLHKNVSLLYDRINSHDEAAARIVTESEELQRQYRERLSHTQYKMAEIDAGIEDARERFIASAEKRSTYDDVQEEVEDTRKYIESRTQERLREMEQNEKVDPYRENKRRIASMEK